MSWQTLIQQEIASIKTWMNQIISNSKKIEELPAQTVLDLSSKVAVSRGGVSEHLDLQLLATALQNNTFNGVVSIDGDITVSGNDVLVPATTVSFQNSFFSTATTTTLNTPYTSDVDLEREDWIAFNTVSGNIERVSGTETAGIVVPPSLPSNCVFIAPLQINYTTIGISEQPYIGDAFIKKSDAQSYAYPFISGTDAVIPIHASGASTVILNNSSLVSVAGFDLSLITGNPSAEGPYNGKVFKIENKTPNPITLQHLGTAEIGIFIRGEESDLVIPAGQFLYLVYGISLMTTDLRSWSGDVFELPEEDIWTYFKGDLYMCQATGSGLTNIGYSANPTLVGTGNNIPANLSGSYSSAPYGSWNYRRQISSSTAGSSAESYWAFKRVSVGLGFYASAKVNVLISANSRFFFGLSDSISAFGNVNPSTLTNILGFGIDSGDSNLQIIHNDLTSTATKNDLGTDFAINNTSNNTYLIEMWNFQGSNSVFFRIKNLLNEVTSNIIEVTTDLPTVTDGLAFRLWLNNGTDASAVQLHYSNHTLKRQS